MLLFEVADISKRPSIQFKLKTPMQLMNS